MKIQFLKLSLKTFFLSMVFMGFALLAEAQSSINYLEGVSLEKAMVENIKNGLPAFNGMKLKYTITFNQVLKVSNNSSQIISEIESIANVIECVIDIENREVVVKCPKSQINNELALIKEKLALFDIRMLTSKEEIYKN